MPGIVAAAQNPDAGVGVPDTHRTQLSTSVDIIDMDGNNIGYISQFGTTGTRNVTRIRHLNSDDAGRVIEQAPNPEDRTVNVTGFALYNKQSDGSVIQRLGGRSTRKKMAMLEEQKIPFNIVEVVRQPATGEEETTVYHNCWLTNFSKTINIGTATIAQTATLSVEWVE
jgi:hypothetical protein